MKDKYIVKDIQHDILNKLHPTVVMWNRLEGRPRTHNFDRAFKAEVRDALWMLTKQWQMGEFKGDDAGSPVFAKVHIATSQLNKYKASNQQVQTFEDSVPLEAKVEQKKIPFLREGKELSIDIRLEMGRYWLKLIKKDYINYISKFIKEYTFHLPIKDKTTDYIYAHKDVWQQYAAISGRCMDGYNLYGYLKSPPIHKVSDNISLAISNSEKTGIDKLGEVFCKWFETLYYQPIEEKNNAWLPERLEYQFACSAPETSKEKVLIAEEYYHGHLDWYGFDIDAKLQSLGNTNEPDSPDTEKTFTNTFIPAQVQFDGMPDTRWWKFEDGKTNLGDIKPSTTDLAKLLLMQFGLVYANDWFLIPFTLPIGSLATIKGMSVTNTFGERFWIEASGSGNDNNWQRWNMFNLKTKGSNLSNANTGILLAPSSIKVQESNPLEEVCLIRDEMANMVWGLETIVSLPNGFGQKGNESGLQVRQFHKNLINNGLNVGTDPFKAKISYLAMTSVPENWIPFIPVHKANDNREIQLQRSSMLRIIEGDPAKPIKVKPKTGILRHGLDETPPNAFYLHEEEVPRAGVRVSQAFQRTRWTNGEVFTWLGMQKYTGRGEGNSGLAFDQIVDVNIR